MVCKWNYDAANNSWSTDFLNKINLFELCENNFQIIGNDIREPGTPIVNGLSAKAADELSLLPNTPVGTSMIDAHAGAIGLFGCSGDGVNQNILTKMGINAINCLFLLLKFHLIKP